MLKQAPSAVTIRNPKTGRLLAVRGAGALKESGLSIRPGVDLTKPIAAQVSKDEPKSRTAKG
jgi:hypothetical protein